MTAQFRLFRWRRLPGYCAPFLLPFILTMIMTFFVSGISTLRGVGPGAGFFGIWMESWGLSWVFAFPIVLFVLPLSRKIVAILVAPPPG